MTNTDPQQLIEQFREFLADTADEDSGDTNEIDLYSLFTELAALKNEIKLESRQVKQALDQSRELIDGLNATNQHYSDELNRRRQGEGEVRLGAERPLLEEILEIRDRTEATLDSLKSYRPGLLERLSGKARRLIDGTEEGLGITLRRLDGMLARYRITPIACIGKAVDPSVMRVSGTDHRENQDDGIVLDELRKGFLRDDQVLRLAEVIVNKKATDR